LERDQLKLRTRVEEQAHESFVAFVCALTWWIVALQSLNSYSWLYGDC
jgi:hypothetical protein